MTSLKQQLENASKDFWGSSLISKDNFNSVCDLCNGEGTLKVGDFDNIKEIDCPQCSCRFCNKQNCECDNGQEN